MVDASEKARDGPREGSFAATLHAGTVSGAGWRVGLAASIILLTALSYYLVPGHLYLFYDTLIYVPMLERLYDPTLLGRDFLATRPHLAFTIYDEVALTLRHLTGLGFREILILQQWIFRAAGIFGVYLIARALKLSQQMSLLVAAVFTLGATTVGAALASQEFEPVPRSYALPLILLAVGLVAHRRYLAAGIAGGVALLYHPPIGYPFWTVYLVQSMGFSKRSDTSKRFLPFIPLASAGALLFVLSRRQLDVCPSDPIFHRLNALEEHVLRLAFVPSVWISTWPPRYIVHHLFLGAVAALAFWRIRKSVDPALRFLILGLPLVGLLSMPASYLLLDKMKWSLIVQLQPMRALVYLAIVAGLMAAVAGIKAAEQSHYLEAFLWLAVAYAIPTEMRVLHILMPSFSSLRFPGVHRLTIIVGVLSLLACFAVALQTRRRQPWPGLLLAASILAPFVLLPFYGRVNRFPQRDSPELRQLAQWARDSTSKDALFLFPDAAQDLSPTVFRARALRSVYADWLSNQRANFCRGFLEEWWSRWSKTMALQFDAKDAGDYRALGVDYLVVRAVHRMADETPVFENSQFIVYQVKASP